MAYSRKIYDPAFDQYLNNTTSYRFQFAMGLAFVAVVGFYLYGRYGGMDFSEAVLVGIVIGGMFILIGVYTAYATRNESTWDGVVVEKKILEEKGNTIYWVCIEKDGYYKREIRSENDATLYDYYQIGDKVRYHGKLSTYEKFDKSGDSIIFCNACSFMNYIEADECVKCGCPLLK